MPYAAPGQVSQAPIENGIEITAAQYREAMAGMLRGEVVSTEGGFQVAPPPPPPEPEPPTLEESRDAALGRINAARKTAEAEGVTLDGVRYAGTPGNRQALREAIEYAEAMALESFAAWKTSDGDFIADHPAAEVAAAYQAIGARRGELIAHEGKRVAAIKAATTTEELEGITW